MTFLAINVFFFPRLTLKESESKVISFSLTGAVQGSTVVRSQ